MIARRAYGLLALAAVLVATVILACALKPKPAPPPPVPAILNETLTNEMSDSTVFNAIDREVREFMKYWGIQGI